MFLTLLYKIYTRIFPYNLQYKEVCGEELKYRVLYPKKKKETYPLVLALHGADSRGNDNLKQIRKYIAPTSVWVRYRRKYPCYVIAPQCEEGKKWVDTDWKKGSYSIDGVKCDNEIDKIIPIISRFIENEKVDKSRIYIVGNSMGGYATWYLLHKYPDIFAAALPICGAGDPQTAYKYIDIPIWACHGKQDCEVPVSGTREMIDSIKKAGGSPLYTEYENEGHGVEGIFLFEKNNGELIRIKWLFEQSKNKKN